MDYESIKQYIGNRQQLFSVRESRLVGGRADGVRVIDVHNGGNLSVTIVPDRCMDIFSVRFKGRCLNYITSNGLAHPAYYEVTGEGWSEAFSGGFLYTCGLSNTGLRSGTEWDAQKEHGCIANRPAERVNILETETPTAPPWSLPANEGRHARGNEPVAHAKHPLYYQRDVIECDRHGQKQGFAACRIRSFTLPHGLSPLAAGLEVFHSALRRPPAHALCGRDAAPSGRDTAPAGRAGGTVLLL